MLLAGAPWRRHCWPCAVTERYREDAAGRGTVAELLTCRDAGAPWQQRREAVAKKLATPWRSAIGKMLAGTPWQQRQEHWQQRPGRAHQ